MFKRLKFMALAVLALALGLAQPLRAGWGDDPKTAPNPGPAQPAAEESKPEPPNPVVEDKPSWEKYAFSLDQADGSGKLSFAELARSGRPFVLVWWLSECPVCHMQMPYVQQLARLGEDKSVDVRVVGINMDERDRDCESYIRDKKLNFNVLRDPRGRGTDRHYGVRNEGTPMTYVFKAGGDYAGKLSGYTKNYPARVLSLLNIEIPQQPAGNGISVERADGSKQQRSFQ